MSHRSFHHFVVFVDGSFSYAATPLYHSTAVIILETKQDGIVNLQSVVGDLTGGTSEVNSEVEALLSRGLMVKVFDQLAANFESTEQTKT